MDRISGLSDELLIKILSFLPTKLAVSTSVLSKRWEYLWMWLPNLEFVIHKGSSPSKRNRLRDFLDRNLPLHRAPVIDRFRLELSQSRIDPANIKMWIGIAVSHRLRELEIEYSSHTDKSNVLPSNLYTCKSLVILKLNGEILLDVPRMVLLPSLKTLQLHNTVYFNEESLQRLLTNCPVLEDLSVELHDGDFMEKLTIVVPSLQRLSLFINCSNTIDGIVIETPSLKYFQLKDIATTEHDCLIKDMPNLFEAYLDVDLPLNINSVIGSITSVKRLTICSEDAYDEGFVFNQLEYLKLCRCRHDSSDLLVPLLKDSSNLQVLELLVMDDHYRCGTIRWNQPSTVPECILSSLQTVNWSGYKGEQGERDFAVYILENAVNLKTITIKCLESESELAKFEMIKELALPSRASTTCKLMFDCLD